MNDKNKCAVYLRVSTDAQSTANQRPDVLRLVRARELDVVEIYEENVSATKSRPQYDRMMLAAHQGRFGTIVIWSLDRLGRSLTGNVEALLKLDQCGVRVVSVQEPWLDTSGPVRELLVSIFSWVASQERLRISARTKAGLEQAKRRGRTLGRPKKWIDVDRALALRATNMPIRLIAQKLGVGASTLHRAMAAHDVVMAATAPVVPESGTAEAA